MNLRRILSPLALLLLPLLMGCEEEDAVSFRLRINEDFSGTVFASGLALPTSGGAIEAHLAGATWNDRVQIVASSGEFTDLSALVLDDATFEPSTDGDLRHLKIRLPRGPEARWARRFLPPALEDEARRKRVALTIDPEGNLQRIGTTVKLTVELPGEILSHGLNTRARRMEEDADGRIATLIVPNHVAFQEGKDLVWLLSWQAAE